MDLNKGLVCGLTNDYADFEGTCNDFQKIRSEIYAEDVEGYGNEMKVVETNEQPKKYWKYLGYVLLSAAIIGLIQAVYYIWSISRDDGGSDFVHLAIVAMTTGTIWSFIGWELNNLKAGVIAAGISYAVYLLFWFIPVPDFFLLYYVSPAAAAIYFGYETLSNQTKLLKFVLLTLVIMAGVGGMGYFSSLRLSEDLGAILRWVLGMRTNFESGFFTWEIYHDESWSTTYSIDWVFGRVFSTTFIFMAITYLHNVLDGKQKWGFNLVTLGRKISQKNMALYVFCFYSGIAFLSLGIMGVTVSFFEWTWNNYWELETDYNDYFRAILTFSSGLVLLVYLVGLYRKILLEYYIERGEPISWNFYFGQMPVIGFFVWMNNLSTFKLSRNISVRKLKAMETKSQGLITFLVFIVIIYAVIVFGLAGTVGRVDITIVAVMVFGIMIYFLYLYNESGIYILVGIQMLAFLIVVVLQLLDVYIPENVLSRGLFWSLAQSFLLYPCFHLKMFTV